MAGFALGASLVFLPLGAISGLGGATVLAGLLFPTTPARALRFGVALVLAMLASAQLGPWTLPTDWLSRRGRRIALREASDVRCTRALPDGAGYMAADVG